MNLDHVAIVIRFDKKFDDDNNVVWEETYLKDFMYCGRGGADDAQRAMNKANELNKKHKSSERYYMPVRIDVEKAVKFGLFDKSED